MSLANKILKEALSNVYRCTVANTGVTFDIVRINNGQTDFKVQNVQGTNYKLKYANFVHPPFEFNVDYRKGNSADKQVWIGRTLKDKGIMTSVRIEKID